MSTESFLRERSPSPVHIEWMSSSESNNAAQRWQQLEKDVGTTHLKSSWPWIATWTKHFGETIPYSFAFGQQGQQTIGAALIAEPKYLFVPALSIGPSDGSPMERIYLHHNRLLVADENLHTFADGLMGELAKRKWSVLRMDSMTEDHAQALVDAGAQNGIHVQTIEHPTYSFQFDAIAEEKDVLSALSHHTRHNIRRSMRAFTDTFGPQQLEWANSLQEARDIVEELMRIHTEHWEGRRETGAFNTRRLQDYHRDLVDALFPDRLIAFRVRYGDKTIGCLVNLVEEDGHVTNHRSGFQYLPDNKLKPGYVTNVLFMEEARKRGYSEFDLLTGHGEYKKLITTTPHTLTQGLAFRGPRALAYRAAREIYQHPRARRYIQMTRDVLL